VSLYGARVEVEADASEVFDLLDAELGVFFGIGAPAPRMSPATTLGRVVFTGESGELPRDEPAPIVLHSGSHSYDVRRGRLWDDGLGVRTVESVDTGSVLRMDASARTVRVENPDARRGAEDVRRVVRDLLFLPWLESLGAVVVHGAAIVDAAERAVLVLGDRGAGKTTLFMAAASAEGAGALSCERVVIVPTPEGLTAFACPEKISVFPGTLRSFEKTRHLAGEVSEGEWAREAKVRVPWRDLFAALGLRAVNGAILSRVLFPRWVPEGGEHSAPASEAAYFRLVDHVVTGRDHNRPDWLGWFRPSRTEATLGALSRLKSRAGTWTDVDTARRLVLEGWSE